VTLEGRDDVEPTAWQSKIHRGKVGEEDNYQAMKQTRHSADAWQITGKMT
jgi:hypothetical protein